MLLRMIVVLGAVCALAYGSLRFGLRRLVRMPAPGARRLEVVERIGVAPKQSLLVVRAGRQFLLLGSSEAGITTLAELEEADWAQKAGEDEEEERDGEPFLIVGDEIVPCPSTPEPAYNGSSSTVVESS